MVKITIFGTGTSAERVWNLLEEFDELDVVAFADNNAAKQRRPFHGRPVRSAEQLAASPDCDYVVIASEWHTEITAQLCRLGMADEQLVRCDTPDYERILSDTVAVHSARVPVSAGGAIVDRRELPRVLILSHETLNDSHGTGVLLKRYFQEFPANHLFAVAARQSGRPWLPQSLHVTETGAAAIAALRAGLGSTGFRPDLVFATALHEIDVALLRDVLTVAPPGTPVVQHFMDFVPHNEAMFLRQIDELMPRLTEVWALTEALQALLAAKLGGKIELVTGLLQRLTDSVRTDHRCFTPDFRIAMVGNFYNPPVVAFMREVWRRCRNRLPGLAPVEWYVSPSRVQDLLDAGVDPGLDFVWRGFFRGTRLLRKLADADLGLLALNHEPEAPSNYLRYSLPSRVTEFACAGVPLFALASRDTPLATFIQRHGIGRAASGADIDRVADDLLEFVQDREGRARAGAAGRALAEREFRIERFRDWFNGRMLQLARAEASVPGRAQGSDVNAA